MARTRQVPSLAECFVQQFTFAWADTSEGVSGDSALEEIVSANGSVALVSTLVFSMAWDLLFGSATACYCPVDEHGTWNSADTDYCFCSTAWDM